MAGQPEADIDEDERRELVEYGMQKADMARYFDVCTRLVSPLPRLCPHRVGPTHKHKNALVVYTLQAFLSLPCRTITRRMARFGLVFRHDMSDEDLFNYVDEWAATRPWTVCASDLPRRTAQLHSAPLLMSCPSFAFCSSQGANQLLGDMRSAGLRVPLQRLQDMLRFVNPERSEAR